LIKRLEGVKLRFTRFCQNLKRNAEHHLVPHKASGLWREFVNQNKVIDDIFATFRRLGHRDYGEQVTVLEHSLQAAAAAEEEGAHPTLIAAAVLHDYGHLIHGLAEDIAEHGIDGVHEKVGATYLARWFKPAVTEPVRLHVAAKRYLCAREPAYRETLSPASAQSLALQGGPFSDAEAAEFEASPYFGDAVRLRRYDDVAKVPGATTPDLEHFRSAVEAGLKVGG
jgi:phosphonate degradation associated HDIG domain protein